MKFLLPVSEISHEVRVNMRNEPDEAEQSLTPLGPEIPEEKPLPPPASIPIPKPKIPKEVRRAVTKILNKSVEEACRNAPQPIPGNERTDNESEMNETFDDTFLSTNDKGDETFKPDDGTLGGDTVINNAAGGLPMTRSQTKSSFPFWFSNVAQVCDVNYAMMCDDSAHYDDPITVDDLRHRKDAGKWRIAMEDEINSLSSNETWVLVERPKNCRVVQTKWLFKTKRNENGDVIRHKARLVARGFTQRYGVDYEETYSPVVRYTTVRLLLAWAAANKMKIHQMDVVTAFLQGDIEEEIYLEQPLGFDDGSGKVCRLKRAIYGLSNKPEGKGIRNWMLH